MNISNYVISFIRTYTMLGVGWLLTFAAEKWHIVISTSTHAEVAALAMALISGLYYLVVRFLEHLFPQLGVLLGVPVKPTYFGTMHPAPNQGLPAPAVVVPPPVAPPTP